LTTYATYSDEQLLVLLKKSDQHAFKFIYEQYWEKLFITAHFRLGNPAEAEELVQDVFLNLWRKRTELVLKFSLNTYLATAVKYEVINRLSRQSRPETTELDPQLNISANNTEEKLSLDDLQSQLATLVKALPVKCRLVFTLSREKGFSQRQIAHHLNISENTVESHIKHALRSLRTGLQHFFSIIF
jgi:RNA polymerase sigma-70 factor (family 1)